MTMISRDASLNETSSENAACSFWVRRGGPLAFYFEPTENAPVYSITEFLEAIRYPQRAGLADLLLCVP